MEIFAGIIVFLIMVISLSVALTMVLIKDTGTPALIGAAIISGCVFVVLLIVFALIDFSEVGKQVLPMFNYY